MNLREGQDTGNSTREHYIVLHGELEVEEAIRQTRK